MADEAFALSPISARAVQPSEEDYAAISEAFMETSRGRWFLTEYAKRNRNADTRMVLDAVARIEESLAVQREESVAAQTQAAADSAESTLAKALAAVRSAVEAAQVSATEVLDGLALDQKLAPVRKGARVIREISWRLREIGNDGRICDLIDSQVSVIENGVGQISSEEAKAALNAAFASIADRLAEFGDSDEASPVAEAAVAPPSPAAQEAAPAAIEEEVQAAPAPDLFEVPSASMASAPEAALAEEHATEITDEAADAHDEALLDMVAMEMGTPEPFELDDTVVMTAEEAYIAQQASAWPEMAAKEPVAKPAEPLVEMPAQAVAETPPQAAAMETPPAPPVELSLGSTIIGSGIVRKPNAAASDPLAPIRRMSQAEKIAFFS